MELLLKSTQWRVAVAALSSGPSVQMSQTITGLCRGCPLCPCAPSTPLCRSNPAGFDRRAPAPSVRSHKVGGFLSKGRGGFWKGPFARHDVGWTRHAGILDVWPYVLCLGPAARPLLPREPASQPGLSPCSRGTQRVFLKALPGALGHFWAS